MNKNPDVIIIGAGAAGLMCAIEAHKRGRRVLVLDHANKVGKKILMSGGGRCNFTNLDIQPEKYLSHNPHFCKSALRQYTQWDFMDLVNHHQIPYHEKTKGQLFCDNKASDIVAMLLREAKGVDIHLRTPVTKISHQNGYCVETATESYSCQSLVIATGGLSIPTMGASPFGYQVAQQFTLPVYSTRASLVPLTWHVKDKVRFEGLSGVSVSVGVTANGQTFEDDLLFTHRGVSGPAILQISNYWQPGLPLTIDFLPGVPLTECFERYRDKQCISVISHYLPKRLAQLLLPMDLADCTVKSLRPQQRQKLSHDLHQAVILPNGTEGYRTAEVTLGGVSCDALSSKTMQVRSTPGLFFIGEVLDVTGWLGGYNFQWAWSSGYVAGQYV